mmetsp:Transcript_60826/g.195962  ORF Transcript_60826/g.195962 Transcript_60826/m.195962 type:complete len:239 (+) Transcript_60826:1199-1915(+)
MLRSHASLARLRERRNNRISVAASHSCGKHDGNLQHLHSSPCLFKRLWGDADLLGSRDGGFQRLHVLPGHSSSKGLGSLIAHLPCAGFLLQPLQPLLGSGQGLALAICLDGPRQCRREGLNVLCQHCLRQRSFGLPPLPPPLGLQLQRLELLLRRLERLCSNAGVSGPSHCPCQGLDVTALQCLGHGLLCCKPPLLRVLQRSQLLLGVAQGLLANADLLGSGDRASDGSDVVSAESIG